MIVSMNVPDPIANHLHFGGEEGTRRALEMVALEAYRAGKLSRGQVSELLDLEFNETERFLKDHNAYISLTMEEFQRNSKALDRLLSR